MLAISIIAITFSTILGIVKFYDIIKEKYNIKVRVTESKYTYNGISLIEKKTHIRVSVVNIGKEPVTILNAGLNGKKKDSNYFFRTSLQDKKLETSDIVRYEGLKSEIKKEIDISNKKYVAYAVDSAGRKYYSHNFIKRFLRIKRIR